MFALLDGKNTQPKLNEPAFDYTYAAYKPN